MPMEFIIKMNQYLIICYHLHDNITNSPLEEELVLTTERLGRSIFVAFHFTFFHKENFVRPNKSYLVFESLSASVVKRGTDETQILSNWPVLVASGQLLSSIGLIVSNNDFSKGFWAIDLKTFIVNCVTGRRSRACSF